MSESPNTQGASYPSLDIAKSANRARTHACAALISAVEPYSPADDAGFTAGCHITAVDGQPLRDIIDWRWLSSELEMDVSYIDTEGDEGCVYLERDEGQDWGFSFEGLVFDDVIQCRNACTFCFMHQLPRGLRPSLTLRDDDFRLSFLVGTFVTLTNLTAEDEARILEQCITPLRVSLQTSNAEVRRRLIGKHAAHGLEAFDRLLEAGIEAHAQIVLVPGENDGEILKETLEWAYARPGILTVGIVPLGYTKHQTRFTRSFNSPEAAAGVLRAIEPFQARALDERQSAWVYAADEFYRNALGKRLLAELPAAEFYGDFELFEDGVGIVRATIDDWRVAQESGAIERAGAAAKRAGVRVRLVAGCAQREFLDALIDEAGIASWFEPLYVQNEFFGGNVDVTGLLVGEDIAAAVAKARAHACAPELYVVSNVVLNDDGILLDDMTMGDVESVAGCAVSVVSCSPREYFGEIEALADTAAARCKE